MMSKKAWQRGWEIKKTDDGYYIIYHPDLT